MTGSPEVSVVLPVRDGERWLEAAIVSIRQQTLKELEILVIDDGSTDGSRAIAERHAGDDPRIQILSTNGVGLASALNLGLRTASCEWVARMDADDVAFPQRLERQLAAARSDPDVVAWGSWAQGITEDDRVVSVIDTGPRSREEFHALHSAGDVIAILHPTMILRRDVALDVGGYDPRFRLGEDIELWDRMGERGPLLVIPEPLLGFRIHAASMSTTQLPHGLAVERFIAARRERRRQGVELTFEAFVRGETEARLPTRIRRWLSTRGRIAHRRAGVAYAGGRPGPAAAWFALAVLSHPSYALRRGWAQLVIPRLRAWRRRNRG